MSTKKPTSTRRAHPPTEAARRAMKRACQPQPRDPWAITAPVDTSYRHRVSEEAYVSPSETDLYGALVAYRREED